MAQERERPPAPADVKQGTAKRAYTSPKLIEYGSVAKLTRGTRSIQADATGGGFSKKSCL